MTDCFQPVEKQYGITYEVLKEFKKNNKPYLIVTKSDLVADDKYIEVLDKDLAHIQITITSTDDEIASKYEMATRSSDRIKAIEKLQELGYDVAIRLSPYIIPYVDVDVINAIKCDKIIVEFLRVNHRIKKWFDIDYSEYILKE
jgi:DNA repair photolyase